MIINDITVLCPCCGEELKIGVRRSVFIPEFGLDKKPSVRGGLPVFNYCHRCFFCSLNMQDKVDVEVQAVVASPRYRETWVNSDMPLEDKKYYSAISLATTAHEAANLWMAYCWFLEFEGRLDEAVNARAEAVEILKHITQDAPNFEDLFQRMDSLRQLRRFTEALELIPTIKPLVSPDKDPYLVKLLIFEKKLILAEDSEPHYQSEAQ